MTTSGSNEPSKANASYNKVVGSASQTLGSVIDPVAGTNLESSGAQQYNEGVAEQKAAQAKGYVEGVADTVSGRFNNIVGAVTGDAAKQDEARLEEQKGEFKKQINKPT